MVHSVKARITGIGSYVPKKVLSNKDLEKLIDTSDEWISTRTGMKERRIAADDEFTSDMAIEAGKSALQNSGLDPKEIDMLIVATMTPDYTCPATCSVIQKAMGLENAGAVDVVAACTGYLYGLSMAKAYIESGMYKNILVIASERMSSVVDYTDRTTCILFGDGACSAVVQGGGSGFLIDSISLGADGSQLDLALIPAGGVRNPASVETVTNREHFFKMDGKGIFKHAVRRMESATMECLEIAGLKKEDISWLVPHQANMRIIDAIAKRIDISMEKVFLTIHKYGNTSASSLGIALDELIQKESIQHGEHLLLVAFGVGLTWGAAILTRVEEE